MSTDAVYRTDFDVDALPYVDREVDDPEMKATVERLIDQEMRRMRRKAGGDRSTLPTQVELFEGNPVLSEEWDRVKKKQPLNALDTSRFELKGPKDEEADSVEAWEAAVNNTKARLECQADSMFNLELLQKYGANAWRVHNFQLESYLQQIKQSTEEYRNKINEINRERKAEQAQAAGSLKTLESKWSDLIAQNLQVEIAVSALEQEVEEIRRYKASLQQQQ